MGSQRTVQRNWMCDESMSSSSAERRRRELPGRYDEDTFAVLDRSGEHHAANVQSGRMATCDLGRRDAVVNVIRQ